MEEQKLKKFLSFFSKEELIEAFIKLHNSQNEFVSIACNALIGSMYYDRSTDLIKATSGMDLTKPKEYKKYLSISEKEDKLTRAFEELTNDDISED